MRRLVFIALAGSVVALGQKAEPLRLDKTIELPGVQGRIDHMSVDVKGERLFVSALGNNTVEVIDLKNGKRLRTISDMKQPQGVLYVAENNRLYIANDEDGTVRILDGATFTPLKTLEFGDDADNLRYDSDHQRVYVGYGSGGLGEIDAEGKKSADIKLDVHPESFQLEKNSSRIYVNLPKSVKVAVIDRDRRTIQTTWTTRDTTANYAMSLDEADHRLFVVSRFPARLLVFNTDSGTIVQSLSTVGDCDDVFYDKKRNRIYVSGGEGAISVFEEDGEHYKEMARIATVKGARTSFFSPELDRFYLAVRQQGS